MVNQTRQRGNRPPLPQLQVGINSVQRHPPRIGLRYPLLLPMKRARRNVLRKGRGRIRIKERIRTRIRIRTGTRMRTSHQPSGLQVISRHKPEGRERNWQERQLQASLSPPLPLPRRRRGDERHRSGPEVSRALHRYRREGRRDPLWSAGEAEAEEGEEVAEAGDGDQVGEAEEAEEARKNWTRWMYR